ncbi:MAG: hypothetical protein RIS73_769 [Bacteroidota bacterium]
MVYRGNFKAFYHLTGKTIYLHMRFFSKFVFFCNLCFIVSVVLRFVEMSSKTRGKNDQAIPLPFVEGTIAVLGELALIFNIIFGIIVLILFISKKIKQIPSWIVIFNFICLLAQVYWFFLD